MNFTPTSEMGRTWTWLPRCSPGTEGEGVEGIKPRSGEKVLLETEKIWETWGKWWKNAGTFWEESTKVSSSRDLVWTDKSGLKMWFVEESIQVSLWRSWFRQIEFDETSHCCLRERQVLFISKLLVYPLRFFSAKKRRLPGDLSCECFFLIPKLFGGHQQPASLWFRVTWIHEGRKRSPCSRKLSSGSAWATTTRGFGKSGGNVGRTVVNTVHSDGFSRKVCFKCSECFLCWLNMWCVFLNESCSFERSKIKTR